MLKLNDLALRQDFQLGPMLVSPSRRLIEGPGGRANVEPLIMQVFLLLLDAEGQVVTRSELFDQCWGGVYVGDDSLNRAIAKVRRVGEQVAPGLLEIETIPRTGYRLTGHFPAREDADRKVEDPIDNKVSRRFVVGSGVALAGLAGAGLWSVRSRDNRRFEELRQLGEESLEYGDGSAEPAKYLQQAVAIRPDDAAVQGLLAFALMGRINNVNRPESTADVDGAQRSADIALRLDPHEPNARIAQIALEQATLDLASTEDRLRTVLATAPTNIFAMRLLWDLLQCAGRSREALAFVRRAIAVKPLAASNNYPLAQLLWIVGRTAEADRIIDRAMQFWPKHRYVRFARFTIFAFTGRPRTALAMLENDDTRPQSFSPDSVALWRTSLPALDDPSAANVQRVRDASLDIVKRNPRLTSQAVLTLSALGEVDAAFEIANNLLVFEPPVKSGPDGKTVTQRSSSTAWRFTPWLFIPPAAPLRADARFEALCEGIGLTAYWAKRGIRPDYQLT